MFRILYPEKKRYTWRRTSPMQQARLDFFLTSPFIQPFNPDVSIQPSFQSDHSIIIMKLQLNDVKRGKGLWKLNNSLLYDKEYVDIINNKIDEIKTQYAVPVYNFEKADSVPDSEIQFTINDQLFLETLLMEIRGKTISYSSFKKKTMTIGNLK